jgi:hypothetical protein
MRSSTVCRRNTPDAEASRAIASLVATILVFLMQPAHGQQTCPCSIWTLDHSGSDGE